MSAPGVQITIVPESAHVRRALSRLVAAAADLSEPMEEIGAALVTSTQQRFVEKESPDGDAWAAVTTRYARRKVALGRDPRNVLQGQNHLLQSLAYLAGARDVAVGSNRVYAAIHQLGGTDDMPAGPADIPARPYLGISRDDEAEIAAVLDDHLGGATA